MYTDQLNQNPGVASLQFHVGSFRFRGFHYKVAGSNMGLNSNSVYFLYRRQTKMKIGSGHILTHEEHSLHEWSE